MSQQFHHIPSLLKPSELTGLEQLISKASFVDGKATASMAAKEVKNNQQIDAGNTDVLEQVQKILNSAIGSSPYFQAAAQPKSVHPFLISKYGPGQYYGWHLDSSIMGDPAIRSDLAMTVFLNDKLHIQEENW